MKINKQTLLQKSIDLFREYGYDQVSINQICKSCGITKGSFYHHFESKADVLDQYLLHIHEFTNAEQINEQQPVLEQMWALIEVTVDYGIVIGKDLMKNIWINGLANQNVLAVPFRFTKHLSYQDFLNLLIELTETGQKKGDIRQNVSAKELVSLYLFAFMGISVTWSTSQEEMDVKDEMHKAFLNVFQ